MKKVFLIGILLQLLIGSLNASIEEVPVLYQGRFRPFEAYARLWLYDISHKTTVGKDSATTFLWKWHALGHEAWDNTPLFWVPNAKLKELLGLKTTQDRFSYNELNLDQVVPKELLTYTYLKEGLQTAKRELNTLTPGLWVAQEGGKLVVLSVPDSPPWNSFKSGDILTDTLASFTHSQRKVLDEILHLLVAIRSYKSENSLIMLPQGMNPGEWTSLKALNQDTPNFTPYPDDTFFAIQKSYRKIVTHIQQGGYPQEEIEQLATSLVKGYETLAGTPYSQAHNKVLSYPTVWQLKAETWYYMLPLIEVTIALYAIATFLLLMGYRKSSFVFLILGILVHTVVLGMRCYILGRPPVSNMFETVIYVPWIAVIGSLILHRYIRHDLILFASMLLSLTLLLILKLANLNSSLENVQAVLDSQFWLIIHVLMVVGSYGLFALAAIMGHLFVFRSNQEIGKAILNAMYLGTALLVTGTVLGGVWAAESWGRFWDWDPKESWAFISSCVYLMWIHAYRFNHIGYFGLAIGSIVGFLAISFTWYGVNYILGTGLHSYGFGSGGEIYYYLFLLAETAFVATALLLKQSSKAGKIHS